MRRTTLAVSIVEQPPLDGSRIAALVQTASEKKTGLFHSLRLTEEEAAGKDSYAQSRLLFSKYLDLIRPLGLEMKTHCVRTWIYVRDIDANYAGLVKARNDVFAEEGLTHDTHYIASTGIGGATEGRNAVVAIDFLTRPDIRESDKTYLKALSHLSPTHDYGVAFERGVRLSDGQFFISGTASIDSRGQVLHEGDVVAQADRWRTSPFSCRKGDRAWTGCLISSSISGTFRIIPSSTPICRNGSRPFPASSWKRASAGLPG